MKMSAEEIRALIERRLLACKYNLEGGRNTEWFSAQKAAYEELLITIR